MGYKTIPLYSNSNNIHIISHEKNMAEWPPQSSNFARFLGGLKHRFSPICVSLFLHGVASSLLGGGGGFVWSG